MINSKDWTQSPSAIAEAEVDARQIAFTPKSRGTARSVREHARQTHLCVPRFPPLENEETAPEGVNSLIKKKSQRLWKPGTWGFRSRLSLLWTRSTVKDF